MGNVLRTEYPRPDFVRRDWLSLNGQWEFAFSDSPHDYRYLNDAAAFNREIQVPFVFQSELSGIHDRTPHQVVWYQKTFEIPSDWSGRRIILHFGAVDYEATVWVNGKLAGTNQGGWIPFSFDVTELLIAGKNVLTVKVVDLDATDQPRGKQSANRENWACWYTRSTGIWQSVWLEPVAGTRLDRVRILPNIDTQTVDIVYEVEKIQDGLEIEFVVKQGDSPVTSAKFPVPVKFSGYSDLTPRRNNRITLSIPDCKLWSPENPTLYDLTIRLSGEGTVLDEVTSYFGMRRVEARGNQVFLNNQPYYLRMVLDQGLWIDGLYTPEDVDEYRWDIQFMKDCGFNGVRKHQKIEDPYFYYLCDRMGLLVWAEMPSCYIYDETGAMNILGEWQRVIRRLYNFPSIMAWVPMNESWGVEQLRDGSGREPRAQFHLDAMYHGTKAMDETRLVISNDGWQQATTDLITIHDYTQDAEDLKLRYGRFKENRKGRSFSHGLPTLLPDYEYEGQPILVTEYGGVKVDEQGAEGWGYGQAAGNYDEMLERIKQLTFAILSEEEVCGYCYTQLSDVEQEVNGLCTADRKSKVPVEKYRQVFGINPQKS